MKGNKRREESKSNIPTLANIEKRPFVDQLLTCVVEWSDSDTLGIIFVATSVVSPCCER